MDNKYELIVTICNHGYSQDIMEAAKLAGAQGGTVMHGRGTKLSEKKKFFGILINPEKDILLIVSPTLQKKDIMLEISSKYGIGTEAHAICFSLPVDDVLGFNFEE